uniref:Uncharacterized protein n=1 Tax=Picea glauca TaxID=3330 RepID=A0A124GNV9_PICGL|nr:hypothetical protein ABT39_MTgene3276 [Picea glauca]
MNDFLYDCVNTCTEAMLPVRLGQLNLLLNLNLLRQLELEP